ncbi:MAG: VWA domain-containing protein [Verrucomicrobiae bacterium]|nr:VWA domain-containing protein [Verrucomicrobiae bacterium]
MNDGSRQAERGESRLLPNKMLDPVFGKIYIRDVEDERHVEFTILQELSGKNAEGWRTGVAFDASASMKSWYGRNLKGQVPEEIIKQYKNKGWIADQIQDGVSVHVYKKEAYEDAIKCGYLCFTDNIVEPAAREFIAYLAGEFDVTGKTSVIYWACGEDGSEFEYVGDYADNDAAKLAFSGPEQVSFGMGTKLTPALKYFVEQFKDAKQSMLVFMTDGKLDDLEDVKKFTTQLALDIASGKHNSVKCVLLGIGDDVDEDQMSELDDLDTGTDVDIWDHKIHKEMRGLVEIFAEVVSAGDSGVSNATVYDEAGAVVAKFTDGLPSNVQFTMGSNSRKFTLEVAGQMIEQPVE